MASAEDNIRPGLRAGRRIQSGATVSWLPRTTSNEQLTSNNEARRTKNERRKTKNEKRKTS
jgi:hypothetical protein